MFVAALLVNKIMIEITLIASHNISKPKGRLYVTEGTDETCLIRLMRRVRQLILEDAKITKSRIDKQRIMFCTMNCNE